MEYLAEQMKEKKKKCICINEGGKNFWQKTTIIIFIVSVSVMMYAEISQLCNATKRMGSPLCRYRICKKNKKDIRNDSVWSRFFMRTDHITESFSWLAQREKPKRIMQVYM